MKPRISRCEVAGRRQGWMGHPGSKWAQGKFMYNNLSLKEQSQLTGVTFGQPGASYALRCATLRLLLTNDVRFHAFFGGDADALIEAFDRAMRPHLPLDVIGGQEEDSYLKKLANRITRPVHGYSEISGDCPCELCLYVGGSLFWVRWWMQQLANPAAEIVDLRAKILPELLWQAQLSAWVTATTEVFGYPIGASGVYYRP